MKKKFIYLAAGVILFAASCKEQGSLKMSSLAEEESYVSDTIEVAQGKRILVEELTGVQCKNCPEGAEILEQLNTQNSGALSIVSIHTGYLAAPLAGKSIQDFNTEKAVDLRAVIGNGAKPCAAFDRLPIGATPYKYMLEGSNKWANAVAQSKTMTPTTPLNLYVSSKFNAEKNTYDIEVRVKYTKPVSEKHALHVFVTESDIVDVQEMADGSHNAAYVFNHVFRDAVTPIGGRPFLIDKAQKPAGQTYIYRTSYKIDATDAKKKFWKPENMHITAFVNTFESEDIHVVQVQEAHLK